MQNWEETWYRVMSAFDRDEDDHAVDLAREYAQTNPGEPEAWLLLGRALVKVGDHGAAEGVFREGHERHPSYDRLPYWLANVLASRDRLHEARDVLESLKAQNPASPLHHLGLAEVSLRGQELEQARTHARDAFRRLDASDTEHGTRLALIALELSMRDEALQLVKNVVAAAPKEWAPRLLLSLLIAEEDRAEADKQLKRAQRSWKGRPEKFAEQANSLREWLSDLEDEPSGKPE